MDRRRDTRQEVGLQQLKEAGNGRFEWTQQVNSALSWQEFAQYGILFQLPPQNLIKVLFYVLAEVLLRGSGFDIWLEFKRVVECSRLSEPDPAVFEDVEASGGELFI